MFGVGGGIINARFWLDKKPMVREKFMARQKNCPSSKKRKWVHHMKRLRETSLI